MNSDSNKLDEAMLGYLNDPIPPETQSRLEQRFAEFEERMVQGASETEVKRLLTRRGFHWAMATSAAAVVAGTAGIWHWTAPPAWAEVTETVQSRPWMHMVSRHPNGAKLHFWASVSQGILAMKAGDTEFATFLSRAEDARWTWRAPSSVIKKDAYRTPPGELGHLDILLSAFASGKTKLKVPGEDKILSQSRKNVEREGEKRWQYTFTLRAIDEGPADTYVVIFEVDPKTRLPLTWTRRSLDGSWELAFDIDYPESGPKDIYALGVPKSAKVASPAQ